MSHSTTRKSLVLLALAGLTAGLASCNDEPVDITTPDQKAQFRESCASKGGTIHQTSCNGTSKCKGLYLNGETGKVETTECAGKNTCAGLQCLDTTVAPMDTAKATATLQSARTLAAFNTACASLGKTTRTEAECAGHNTCAGIRFLVDSAKTETTSCAGHGSCRGVACPL
ncbi:MAG: hypothetical protein IPN71_00625 [Fibrobacteres bacterium]|jgi:hypothetical protein|nr:hypothetical protein [Fibrobacterota bacterium]